MLLQCSDALAESTGALRLIGHVVLINWFVLVVTWNVMAVRWVS